MIQEMKHVSRDTFIKYLQSVPESEVLEQIQTESGRSKTTDRRRMEREEQLHALKRGLDSDVVEQCFGVVEDK